MMVSTRSIWMVRCALMASACVGSLVAAPQALAQDSAPVTGANAPASPEAQRNRGLELFDPVPHAGQRPTAVVTPSNGGASVGVIDMADVVDTPAITINNNFTPTDARDPVNINGIGQIVTDGGGGSVGLCTGTLINPRTVLFAAHCVNTRAATAYGANSGGVAAAVGFETNTRANAPGQVDELVNWLLGAGAGPGQFRTNQAQALYNLSQVFYDPRSLAPASCTGPTSCFLEADIATGILDTPAGNIPTWALLFSPLDAPASINAATGTGYHVTVTGYGRFGTGTTGQNGGNDFRRRVAENMLGALVSLNDRNLFLFGTTGVPSRPQPLYFLDFDDPARGTAAANPRDFNGFRDNALPREGLTGPGDSGGPLILDQHFSRQVVIGVLSGGSTFFAGQPGGSYGAQSFYQPVFLYWDWIVANNPYRYVTAIAGNRNWEDASGWVTELDPNYQIIVGGQLVNGVPTSPGAGATTPPIVGFGEMCFQSPLNTPAPPATNECQNIRTGAFRNNVPNNPSDMVPVNGLTFEQVSEQTNGARNGLIEAVEEPLTTGYLTTPNPAPTLANGLPGATNFVPNNVDGVRATGTMGRYYDVTLRNTGAVTLNSTVTVDRFTISGATSQLNVASGSSLTSLIEIRQLTGTINNNGTLVSRGDYLLMSGLLTGSGTVRTPFLTSVMGTIAPGTTTTIGTVNVNGNLVLSSGSSLMINLGAGGTTDLIALTANGTSTGAANLGGGVFFSPVAGYRPMNGDRFTFLTAAGGVTGTFTAPATLSAILRPQLNYSANAVSVQIIAGNYRDVIAPGAPIQSAYAQLLDQNRTNAGALPGLYSELDLLSQAAVRSNLDAMAPNHVPIQLDLGTVGTEMLSSFVRDRMARVARGDMGGSVATYGRPLQLASLALAQDGGDVRSDAGSPIRIDTGAVADNVSLFLAGGYVDGRGSSLPFTTAGRSDFDGFYLSGGGEVTFDAGAFVGFALGYSDLDGRARNAAASASGRVIQGTLYGGTPIGEAGLFDLQIGAGQFRTTTARIVPIGATVQTLVSEDDALAFTAEAGLSYRLGGDTFAITPRFAMRYSEIGFTPTAETGGSAALRYNLDNLQSLQGRIGVTASARRGAIRPFANVTFVNEFEGRGVAFGANFRSGIGDAALFALPTTDENWFEVSGGLSLGSGNFSGSIAGETQLGRNDVRSYSVRGSLVWRF